MTLCALFAVGQAAELGWLGPQVGGLHGGYEAYRCGCLYGVGEALVQMQWDQAALGCL